jgi:multidrug efflux pump subunit AcrB
VAAGIPVSLLAALAAMHLLGLTINMISIFALIITVGIVVDDAIVVGEHADYRVRVLGETPQQASENSAIWMAGPVLAATVTTMIAFLGLLALSGSFGGLIEDIPLTVVAVLAASMIESFLIMPNHMAHALEDSAHPKWYDFPNRTFNRGLDWFRQWLWRPLMRAVVWARYPVVALVILLWCYAAAAFINGEVQWRFFSAPEEGAVSGNFSMLPGADRADTMA